MRLLGRRREEWKQKLVRRRVRLGFANELENNSESYTADQLNRMEQCVRGRDDVLDEVIDEMERRNPALIRQAESDGGPRDWAGFFAGLAQLLQAIQPLLEMLFGLFGGLAQHAPQLLHQEGVAVAFDPVEALQRQVDSLADTVSRLADAVSLIVESNVPTKAKPAKATKGRRKAA